MNIEFSPTGLCKILSDAAVTEMRVSSNLLSHLTRGLRQQKSNPFDNYFDHVAEGQPPVKDHVGYLYGKPVFLDRDIVPNTVVIIGPDRRRQVFVARVPGVIL